VKRPIINTCEGARTVESLFGGQFSNVDSLTSSAIQGTLIGASLEIGVPTCGDSSITSPGVWYTVYGTGCRMRAFFNEFGEETDFDARVSVFRGSCSSLECVEQDDSLRWNSCVGELYSMLVYGADGSSGDFGLFVDLGNEVCTDVVNPLRTNETIWVPVANKGSLSNEGDVGDAAAFNAIWSLSPNQILKRKCLDCVASHQDIYYRRFDTEGLPGGVDLFDIVKNSWFNNIGNTFRDDFKLYSTYSDAVANSGAWAFCNFNNRGVGFPGDCGPTGFVADQWNSFEGGRGGRANIGFYVETACG
jgi:hypothetical protein